MGGYGGGWGLSSHLLFWAHNQPTGLQNDGFWERIIGGPFKEHRSRKALKLLHLLIGACMMRHSKGQVRKGGTTPTK